MAVHPALKALMKSIVTIEPFASNDDSNQPTYSTGVAYTCRVERKPKMIWAPDGTQQVSNVTIYFGEETGIGLRDRITLPDGTQPIIMSIARHDDELGGSHEVVYA